MAGHGIAIVGMAGRFAQSDTIAEFWDNLVHGRELLGSNARFDAEAAARGLGHWVEQIRPDERDSTFDAALFGLSPREAERLEPQQRAFLELGFEAMEDGGYNVDVAGPRVGVFGGANFTSYYALGADSHLPDALDEMIGADKDYLATRVAHHLGLQGPAVTVQSACSTSLVAVHLACQSLMLGECDAALAGGASLTKPRMTRYFYTPGGILSPDGFCRAFDADAQGTVFTDGVGMVLLMRLEDALARGHQVYAVIRGSAINNDGGGKASYMAPSIAGQERVIREAFRRAGVSPGQVGYIEAHGTATVLGDAIELAALGRVFRGQTDEVGACRIGSVKTNIGHTASAAGVAGLMKAALALRHGFIPPHINFKAPNPDLDFETSPFFVDAEGRAWSHDPARSRFAGVSSFGVGGTNAHAILEEAPRVDRQPARRPVYVLTLSARSDAALSAASARLGEHLKDAAPEDLADAAYSLNVGRKVLDYRATVVCADPDEAREALEGRSQSTALSGRIGSGRRTVGWLFPGQGSQYLGMGSGLLAQEPVFRAVVEDCLAILQREHGLDLAPLFRQSESPVFSETDIAQTRLAQPYIFVVEYALGRQLMAWSARPAYAMGHSIGEYAAACLAGVFNLEDALRLVVLRGELMQALEPGAMLSVAAPPDAFELPAGLDIAALNGPRQTVVSGRQEDIEAFAEALAARQLLSTRLRTSHAFHSRMMEPMLEAFREALVKIEIRTPAFPLVSNLTGAVALTEQLRKPDYWLSHIRQPVRFAEGLAAMVGRGVDVMLEVGPGRQLSSLAQQNGVHRQGVRILTALPTADGAEPAQLMRALARLWLEGAEVDWAATYGDERRRMAALPAYPFERQPFRTEPLVVRPGAAAARGKLPVDQWLYAPSWRRIVPESRLREDDAAPWLVFEPARLSAGSSLTEALTARGVQVIRVNPDPALATDDDAVAHVDPGSEDSFIALFERLKAANIVPERLVHGWSLGRPGSEDLRAGEVEGVQALVRCLRAARQVLGRTPLMFDVLTAGAQDVTGAEALDPGAIAALGFARVAPQENGQVKCRAIDLDLSALAGDAWADVAGRVADVLLCRTEETLALRNGYWWTQAFDRLPSIAGQASRLKTGGVYLITGGMGHVGQIFARHLAAQWGAKLVLAGRSAPDTPQRRRLSPGGELDPDAPPISAHLDSLRALGGEAIYVQADAASLADARRLRQTALDRFGRIDGVIFGAGTVQASSRIDEIEDAAIFDENFQGKVGGLQTALAVFGEDELDFAVVLSSISTVLGGLALCAYSAANHIADALVLRHRRAGHGAWITTNWDIWADSLLTDDAERRFGRFLDMAIQPTEGAQALEAILGAPPLGQVIVSAQPLQPRIDLWIHGLAAEPGAAQVQHKRPSLASAYVEPEGEMERQIAEIWGRILGIETIGRDDDFFEMGGHSILAVQAAVQIQEIAPPSAPNANLYEYPTVRLLAAALSPEGAANPF